MKQKSNIIVASWNICRGLATKLEEIKEVIRSEKLGIVSLHEIDDFSENIKTCQIENYEQIIYKSESKIRSVTYIHNSINYIERTDLMTPDIPSIWIEVINTHHKNVLICSLYREWKTLTNTQSVSTSNSLQHQIDRIEIINNQIARATTEKKPKLIMGDINLCMSDWNVPDYSWKNLADLWRSIIKENGLSYEFLGPTYFSNYIKEDGRTKTSCLDHIYFTDHSNFKNPRKLTNSLSDHVPILIDLKISAKEKQKSRFILRRNFKILRNKSILNKFLSDLSHENWEILASLSDTNEKAKFFDSALQHNLDKYAPISRIKIKEHHIKGLSVETKQLIKQRDKCKERINKVSTNEKFIMQSKYKSLRNRIISNIRKEKKAEAQHRIEKTTNKYDMWKLANSVIKQKQHNVMILEENGTKIEDELSIAEVFNSHFVTKIESIRKSIPKSNLSPYDKLKNHLKDKNLFFSLKPVTTRTVKKAIIALKNKNSSGVDFISSNILKSAINVIAEPLTYLVNSSILEGIFPDTWKTAKVIPIYKGKGSTLDKNMYRPISNLKSASKILEMVVNYQVIRYMEANKLFPHGQHGFRANRSTFSALANMQENWLKAYESGHNISITLFDLSIYPALLIQFQKKCSVEN